MSVLTSLGILLLAMLIMAFLQFIPGVFTLFLHYTSGRFSKTKASDLATFFIVGVETAVSIFFVAIYCILSATPDVTFIIDNEICAWILAGILAALGILLFFAYFQKGKTTKLRFFPNFTTNYHRKAKTAKNRSDAFLLGLFSTLPELIFTIPIYIISVITIMNLGINCPERAAIIILFAIVTVLPLIIYHALYASGRNLADFTRFRFKNKSFFRFTLALLYYLIATFIILGVLL